MTEAIVLAGGMGTRLRGVVSGRPKVLAPVAGRPFLDYILEYLSHYGITHVTLSVCYKKEQIQSRYKDKFRDITIDYCEENEPLGTGGAIQKSLLCCKSEDVFVLNGDSIFWVPLDQMQAAHKKTGAAMTLTVRQVPDGSRYGRVLFDAHGRIQNFSEKNQAGPAYINGGVYYMKRRPMQTACTPLTPPFSLENDVLPKLVGTGADIRAIPSDAFFIDIGIPESFEAAQTLLPRQFFWKPAD